MSQCASDPELEEAISEMGDDLQRLILWSLSAMAHECDSPTLHSIEAHNQQRRRWASVLAKHLEANGW